MTRQELRVQLWKWMCGCGSPEAAVRFVYDVLSTIRTRWKDTDALSLFKPEDRPAMEAAWKKQAAAMKAILPTDGIEYFTLYILTDWDLIEHGGSVGGSWLTDKGKAMLTALDSEAADELEALCGDACVHGYDVGDESHDCMTFKEPVSADAVATSQE